MRLFDREHIPCDNIAFKLVVVNVAASVIALESIVLRLIAVETVAIQPATKHLVLSLVVSILALNIVSHKGIICRLRLSKSLLSGLLMSRLMLS